MRSCTFLFLFTLAACSMGQVDVGGDEARTGTDGGASVSFDAAADEFIPGVDAGQGVLAPDATPPPPPPPGEPSQLTGITAAHNEARALKGLELMTWDDDLAAVAKAWADTCTWAHNSNRSATYPGYVGENLYASGGVPSGKSVVQLWVAEEANYNYETNSCVGVCGHYTQVVWAQSIRVGCGIASCPSGPYPHIVVCDYSPGGNVNGARPY